MIKCLKPHVSLDLPDAKIDSARFIYNFFTKDERVNSTGVQRIKQRPQDNFPKEVLDKQVPRSVVINFSLSDFEIGSVEAGTSFTRSRGSKYEKFFSNENFDTSRMSEFIQSENDVCSIYDESVRYSDSLIRERLKAKSDLLSMIIDRVPGTSASTREVANMMEDKDNQDAISDINSTLSNPNASFVNDVGEEFRLLKFEKATRLSLKCYLNKSSILNFVYSDLKSSSFNQASLLSMSEHFENVNSKLSNGNYYEALLTRKNNYLVVNPRLAAESSINTPQRFDGYLIPRLTSHVVGYIVKRKTNVTGTSKYNERMFYLDGSRINSFIDTEILYGKTYFYEVSAIFRLKYDYPSFTGLDAGKFKSDIFLVRSDFSPPVKVKCIEKVPPKAPAVTFYNFDYGKEEGLLIDWRIPGSKQRDIKYFQVFRRKTIHEPFTCIALLDFDDSLIRTVPIEKVRNDSVYKTNYARAFFKDYEFNRESNYIYAIATVDAHGLSSPYGPQSLVSFNQDENSLNVRRISRSGAPKQYPNFFIDPEMDVNVTVNNLTQDVMMSSNKRKIRVYLDADCRYLVSSTSGTEEISKLGSDNAFYKLHMVNIDRQKSADYEIRFEDSRREE